MRINIEHIIVFVFVLLFAVIGYQQYEIYSLRKVAVKEFDNKIKSINRQIHQSDSIYMTIYDKIDKLQKKDSLTEKNIRRIKFKLRIYEKAIKKSDVDRLTRDSIRRILTE